MSRVFLIISTVLRIGLSGCAPQPKSSLYQQLGAEQGIERIVNAFIKRIAKDKTILPYFAKSSVSHFRTAFLCMSNEVTS